MIIGIDASRAFIKERTGIEEYSYQVIKHLRDNLKDHRVVLYLRSGQIVDFELSSNWSVKNIWLPRFWTQVGLSRELWKRPVDILFVPAHTVSWYHPEKTLVVVHGLEYEFYPDGYSFWERWYMRWSIKNSCKWASKIIAVSQNTKKDLIDKYNIPESKIEVIHEGCGLNSQSRGLGTPNSQSRSFEISKPYFLFVGRIEKRKNIFGIIKAFEILKKKYNIFHKLVLAGKMGYGYEEIKKRIDISPDREDIILTGFVSEQEKQELMKNAEIFLFPSLYEGFGLPVLEAQMAGIPVVTSNSSSLSEVAGVGAALIDPNNSNQMAEEMYRIISDKNFRDGIIKKGRENLKRFSWEKCAREIANLLDNQIC